MITVGYSTRKSKPEFIEYVQKTSMYKEIQVIEKINNGDKSLSQVYNEILDESKHDIVVFCHDDIEFDTNRWGEKLLKIFDKNPEYGIIGVAGTTDLIDGRWWTIKKSMNGIVSHKHEGKKWTNNYSEDFNNNIKEVVVIDGLFICVNKTKLKHRFDETFNGFHFYDLGFCFPNYLDGVKIGVTTSIRLTHLSIGQTNQQWEDNKLKFEEKYKDKLPVRLTNNKTLEEKLLFNPDSVGIGMVTYNAEDRIKQSSFTVPKWLKNFVIVNDGTPYDTTSYPEHAHVIQHDTNKSVGQAKNTALKYLMDAGCEHIFLMEDDILIRDESVFEEYIKHSLISGIKHLNFALHGPRNRKPGSIEPNIVTEVKYSDDVSISFYTNCVGAFSYYQRGVIDKVGYIDTFYKNAWDHVDHTLQIIKKGLHPSFWFFADISNSEKFLNEIPESFENSTISKSPEWIHNMNKGIEWFKKKNGVSPMDIPRAEPNVIQQQLQILFNNRDN